jgi:calpain-15
LLLEKAWAKVYGSYQRIEAGTTGEALPCLTGSPTEFFFHAEVKDKEVIWKKIREADQKNYIIATAVSSGKQGKTSDEMKNVGLVDAHAYSMIGTTEIKDNAKTVRLL